MSSKDTSAEDRAEPRSEFLRGQMREWLDQVGAAGKTRDLFELEMWLRSFERFFRIKNQPLSEKETNLLALLIDKKFKPIHDRITNHAIAAVIRRIERPTERKQAARVFLEFFRLLHYLDYADPSRADEELKNTILVFSLITSETRLLLGYLERRALRSLAPATPLYELYDSFVYCIPLELKKVINTELLDISVARQSDNVRARVENSHGILKDCFQQSVVQLAQVFDPAVSGRDIFPDFTAKLEQSVQLRDSLGRLIKAGAEFEARRGA